MKNSLNSEVHKKLYDNSVLFLRDGIERLVAKDSNTKGEIDKELLILTCTSFQISLELAIKSLVVKSNGIQSILHKNQQNLNNDQLLELITNNKIKTVDFDRQKNLVKSQNLISNFKKNDFKIIEEFQKYRNKMVHFSYHFQDDDLYSLKHDVIYYMIHVIFEILISIDDKDLRPSEFLEYKLKGDLHKKLTMYTPYIQAMAKIAKLYSDPVFTCINCDNRTYASEEKYCYCCNFGGDAFFPINCDHCQEKESVIYDNLNISINGNLAKGLCLNCGQDGIIFQCPKCHLAHNIETAHGEYCNDEKCINF